MVQCLRRYLVLPVLALLVSGAVRADGDLASARPFYLDSLFLPHRYVPGKQSFLMQKLKRGDRRLILDLAGSGSVRHVWSTWTLPVENHRIVLRVYVDGARSPAIAGTFAELCRAARQTGVRYVPLPAFIYKGTYNIYLPIFFVRSIRMEIEALDDCDEFYTQIDYRLTHSERDTARLLSAHGKSGLTLKYRGKLRKAARQAAREIRVAPAPGELILQGPAILRSLSFRGDHLEDLYLTIFWDDDPTPAVSAPLRYFFADFVNAAMESVNGKFTCYFPMPFARRARIVLRDGAGRIQPVVMHYTIDELPALPQGALYFHAQYAESARTDGYEQYRAVEIHGAGHFVGINLFDTGPNHGGGDAALIDGGTAAPLVLHGICGEDYFSFAWHNTGTMTPLSGAPVHTRRFRLHLENPYPFHESFQFLFGAFAGLHPKSVGFWYQARQGEKQEWAAVDAPWQVLGPLNPDVTPPATPDGGQYESVVNVAGPMTIRARWEKVRMRSGFLDLTYHFRHYVMTNDGNGFVAGRCRMQLSTYVYSPVPQLVEAMIGEDDGAVIAVNGSVTARLPVRSGFHASQLSLPLHRGWNSLAITLSNDENVDWRWSGLSFALKYPNTSSRLLFR